MDTGEVLPAAAGAPAAAVAGAMVGAMAGALAVLTSEVSVTGAAAESPTVLLAGIVAQSDEAAWAWSSQQEAPGTNPAAGTWSTGNKGKLQCDVPSLSEHSLQQTTVFCSLQAEWQHSPNWLCMVSLQLETQVPSVPVKAVSRAAVVQVAT